MKLGYAICGSFCNLANSLSALQKLKNEGHEVTVILSEACQCTDTRFMTAAELKDRATVLSDRPLITDIVQAERIGPEKMFDVLVVSPCTSNTLAKITKGVTDGAVTMAVKSHVRNERPVLLAIATNDGLGASAVNIGAMLNRRNFYFVPFAQDDPVKKPRSTVCLFNLLSESVFSAAKQIQLQPVIR